MKILVTISTNLYLFHLINGSIFDYIEKVGSLFKFQGKSDENELIEFSEKIPYEVSQVDEKFIQEASKFTGIALSDLDSCTQRVILKLKGDCHKLNDEQISKLAVALLNCQSYIEGRRIYPCTDEMSIAQCTKDMDSDTWTSYHLMSNRARAVCYSIRQLHFRGLAEHTVNNLMEAAQNQLKSLTQIQKNQIEIRTITEDTFETITKGHQHLVEQQENIGKAQFQGLLTIEDNIKRLLEEKQFIISTHEELVGITKFIQSKLELFFQQLKEQAGESRENHGNLIEDILAIQEKTQTIYRKTEEFSELLLRQNENFKQQYTSTLKNLAEVNKTVHNLVSLMNGTRYILEERLNWITQSLGGTDLAVERLYLIIWHSVFMLLSMLICAFLSVKLTTRLIVSTLPPLNLAIAFFGEKHFDPFNLTILTIFLVLVQNLVKLMLPNKPAILMVNEKLTLVKNQEATINLNSSTETYQVKLNPSVDNLVNGHEYFDEFDNFTPPLSRIGSSRSRSNTPSFHKTLKIPCHAKTRMGTPCKLFRLPGKDHCYRHQRGDSVING